MRLTAPKPLTLEMTLEMTLCFKTFISQRSFSVSLLDHFPGCLVKNVWNLDKFPKQFLCHFYLVLKENMLWNDIFWNAKQPLFLQKTPQGLGMKGLISQILSVKTIMQAYILKLWKYNTSPFMTRSSAWKLGLPAMGTLRR